jgi:hypothetical protein
MTEDKQHNRDTDEDLAQPKTPTEKTINSTDQKITPERKSDNSQNLPPQIPLPLSNAVDSCKCCHHKTPWWKILLDVATLVVLFVYACTTFNMWREMQKDRRAWVGIQGFQCTGCAPVESNAFVINGFSGVIQNTGKTPALKLILKRTIKPKKWDEPPPNPTIDSEYEFPIPADIPADQAARIRKNMDEEIKRQTEVIALSPNSIYTFGYDGTRIPIGRFRQTYVYIIGKITYSDVISNVQHTTTFCLVDDKGAGFRFCSTGNDMD